MLWTFVERITNLVILLLALILLTKVGLLAKEQDDSGLFDKKVTLFQEENKKVIDNNFYYLETRINKLSEAQDNYQNTSFSRINILEQRLIKLEKDNKQNNKVVNNNINTLTAK